MPKQPSLKILIVSPMFKGVELLNDFKQALPQAEFTLWTEDTPSTGAQYAVGWQPSAQLFINEPQLKAFFNLGAGVDAILKHGHLPPNITLIRLEDAGMSNQIAEYALHTVTRISRQFNTYEKQQTASRWEPHPPTQRSEWSIGILGLGVIGSKIAHLFSSLGYPTRGWSRQARELPHVECYSGVDELPMFLKNTRVLINILPLTPDTRGILNKHLFAQLPKNAYLINVGRGEHLNEDDLLTALDTHQLAGATLDVFSIEPLPESHPFWQHPKVTITPHISGQTLRHEAVQQISQKLLDFHHGHPVTGIVDMTRGY